MILGEPKRATRPGKWDLLLAEAEYLLSLEQCQQCGQPKYICHNDDPDITFHVSSDICYATQARAKAEKSKTQGGKKELPAGLQFGTEPYTYSKTPLDDLRNGYYEKRQKEWEKLASERKVLPRQDAPKTP